jgi:3-deoxy-D-manno-octulosonate 8-phosphate phosphatase KdsC-like HAD superfamily phosphatase
VNGFLANVGLLAIAFVVIYAYKKIQDYYYFKHSAFYENERIYEAAHEFVRGVSVNDIKAILASCLDFDEEDAEKILSQALPHRTDKDGGYGAFIRSVNKVLGEDVYSEQCHTH